MNWRDRREQVTTRVEAVAKRLIDRIDDGFSEKEVERRLWTLLNYYGEQTNDYVEYADDYVGVGILVKKGILFTDWNPIPRLAELAETLDYELEWSDEWATCEHCRRAVRTMPDSYGWQKSYLWLRECEIVCRECLEENPEWVEEAIEEKINNSDYAFPYWVNLEQFGWEVDNGEHENGLYEYQFKLPRPKEIQEGLNAKGLDVVFRLTTVGQFDLRYNALVRPSP